MLGRISGHERLKRRAEQRTGHQHMIGPSGLGRGNIPAHASRDCRRETAFLADGAHKAVVNTVVGINLRPMHSAQVLTNRHQGRGGVNESESLAGHGNR